MTCAKGFVLRSVYDGSVQLEDQVSSRSRIWVIGAIIKRQMENQPWFVSLYQEVYDDEDRLESSCLRLV
jgi:hypothetical protein